MADVPSFDQKASILAPALHAVDVTPSGSDVVLAAPYSRALYIGETGDVKVDMLGGETGITFKAVPAGTTLAIRVTKIYNTGTDSTSIIQLY